MEAVCIGVLFYIQSCRYFRTSLEGVGVSGGC